MPQNRSQLLASLRTTRDVLLAHAQLGEVELSRRYAPGKWTVREVLAHLADCEFIYLWRFGKAVSEPGSTLEQFDQDVWAKAFRYEARPAALSGALFDGARRLIIHSVETLPEALLAQASQHPERGRVTAWQWAEIAAAHTAHHLSQIDAALRGVPWQPRPKGASGDTISDDA